MIMVDVRRMMMMGLAPPAPPSAGITVREVVQNAAVGNVVLNLGAGTAASDILVASQGTHFYTAADMDPPTPGSWTLAALGDDGVDRVKIKIWVAAAPAAGAQQITFPAILDTHTFARIRVLSGAALPIVGGDGNNGFAFASDPIAAPDVLGADGGLLCCDWIIDQETTLTVPVPPMTASGNVLRDFSTNAAGHELLSAGGQTGTRDATAGLNASFASTSVVIPAA